MKRAREEVMAGSVVMMSVLFEESKRRSKVRKCCYDMKRAREEERAGSVVMI